MDSLDPGASDRFWDKSDADTFRGTHSEQRGCHWTRVHSRVFGQYITVPWVGVHEPTKN